MQCLLLKKRLDRCTAQVLPQHGGGSRAGAQSGLPLGITGLVFGREESGLSEAEVHLCTHACALPTGRIQGSMNLSHAVATVQSEVRLRGGSHGDLRLRARSERVGWKGLLRFEWEGVQDALEQWT